MERGDLIHADLDDVGISDDPIWRPLAAIIDGLLPETAGR